MAWRPVDQLAASNSSLGVCMATSKVAASARKYSSSIPNEYSEAPPPPAAERITRWRLSPLRPRRSNLRISGSNRMALHPGFEQGCLPQPGVPFRAHLGVWMVQHVLYEIGAVQASASRLLGRENVPDITEERPAQIP